MKKSLQIIYTTAFLALCAAPLAFIPLTQTDGTAENRQLSQMPDFLEEDGSINLNWSSRFETYFSEHFAFRPQLVTLDSLIKSEVFKTSSSEKVIVGNSDWLYFAETLPDYTGENAMSERKLYNTAKTIALMQEHFENDGRKFLYFTAPNKNSVYPENMPKRYVRSSQPSNRERLAKKLDELGVNHIELAPIFSQCGHTLYLERDSHWTNEGALVAFNAAADALGMAHDDFAYASHCTQKVWHSDLDGMLFPSYERLSEQEVYDIDFTFDYRSEFVSEDDMMIKTKGPGEETLLMYRDSFGRAFYPFAAENTAKASFSRAVPYKTELADELDAQNVILEIVERNLANISKDSPIMNAVSRDMDVSASIEESDKNICEVSDKGRNIRIYGILDEKYFADNSNIYITLETDGAVYAYEAFPVYESELLEDPDGENDYAFSLRIAKEEIPAGDYEIFAYVEKNGEYICTQPLAELSL